MKDNRDKFYLERIIESIDRVANHLSGFEYDDFVKDEKTYDAALMQLC